MNIGKQLLLALFSILEILIGKQTLNTLFEKVPIFPIYHIHHSQSFYFFPRLPFFFFPLFTFRSYLHIPNRTSPIPILTPLMTMGIPQSQVEYLAQTLQTRPVTYHTAARDLKIHVSKSKEMLFEYYNVNKDRLNASFLVTGTRQGNTVVHVFQNETEYASQTADFDEIRSVHVYCLSEAKNVFLASEIALEELQHKVDIGSLAQYYDCGLTKGTDVSAGAQIRRGGSESRNAPEHTKKVDVKTELKPKIEEEHKSQTEQPRRKLEYQSRKEKATPSILSNYVSRKTESKVPEKRTAPAKPAFQYKSRKVEQNQPKERVVMSMEDEPEHEEPQPVSTMENLFLDDLSDFSDTVDDIEEPIVVETKAEETEKSEEAKQSPAPQVPEDSIFRTMTSNTPAQRTPTPPPQTTVDDDGYITTYRAKDPVKEPVKEPVRKAQERVNKPKKNDKKNDGKKKQASLMSFFGKQ